MNQSINDNIPHCECVKYFRLCLEKLNNTSLSSEFEFFYSINATKCSSEFDESRPYTPTISVVGIFGQSNEPKDLLHKKKHIFDDAMREILQIVQKIGCNALERIENVESDRVGRQKKHNNQDTKLSNDGGQISSMAVKEIQSTGGTESSRVIVKPEQTEERTITDALKNIKDILTAYCKNKETIDSFMPKQTHIMVNFYGPISNSSFSFA
ncbi:hypothetical protein HA402_015978 [Bradysia odoriphaga]|nr:hypothetical protein HA402_015978 [Bradysia odoriphaga]